MGTACGLTADTLPPYDAGTMSDAGAMDAGTPTDAGVVADAGAPTDSGLALDAGPVDAGEPIDAGTALDAGLLIDAGLVQDGGAQVDGGLAGDGGVVQDAGTPDAGPRDAGLPDAGSADAGVRDAGVRDAGVRDAGPADAGVHDAGPPDAGAVPSSCSPPGTACGSSHSCVALQCLPNCASGEICPGTTYCEGGGGALSVCSPSTSAGCSISGDCRPGATCYRGVCMTETPMGDGNPGTGCAIADNGQDGCGPDAVCLLLPPNGCAAFQHCAANDYCPPGTLGSTCNRIDGGAVLRPGKQRLCIPGFCRTNANCPFVSAFGAARCFRTNPTDAFGKCHYGLSGDPCRMNQDCPNAGSCVLTDGGAVGRCF